jgi:transcriptional regulator with XRE-family HTH domain
MDDARLGRSIRAVRLRRGLRQLDVALAAGVRRQMISAVEAGALDTISLRRLRAIGNSLGIHLELLPRWRGADLDRLLTARHSAMHETVARFFVAHPAWTPAPDVSCSIYGERGVVDVLAWHADSRSLLVVDLKTDIIDVQELLGTLDRKRRLAPRIARDRGLVTHNGVHVADRRGEP